eukprot:scaffold3941_cov201-Alexandrium_tamarense.AAC.20
MVMDVMIKCRYDVSDDIVYQLFNADNGTTLLPSSALFRCVHRHVVAVGSWLLSLACNLATFSQHLKSREGIFCPRPAFVRPSGRVPTA